MAPPGRPLPPPPEHAELRAYSNKVFPVLNRRSYYQLLEIAQSASPDVMRAAFYRIAAQLHPDRYFTLADATTKERLEIIYARITEAYRVLSTPERKIAYDKGLPQGKIRFDFTERERKGPKSPEDAITHPEAKKFFRFGIICEDKKDLKGAAMNFTFARAYEPKSALILEKLAAAQAAVKAPPPAPAAPAPAPTPAAEKPRVGKPGPRR